MNESKPKKITKRNPEFSAENIPDIIGTHGKFVIFAIEARLKLGADIDERCPNTDRTGLHVASGYVTDADLFSDYYIGDLITDYIRVRPGDATLVKFLLENNAAVDALDKLGRTPLYYACMIDCPQVIMLLIDAGADVNTRDDKNISILEHLLTDSKRVKANKAGVLMEADSETLVKINAIRILRENKVNADNLSAQQKANLKTIEESLGEHAYRIGRLSDRVPYGSVSKLEFWNFWRGCIELFMCEAQPNGPLDQSEVQILDTLFSNASEATGTIKERLYILNAFKYYNLEYQTALEGFRDCKIGSKANPHKDLFQGPYAFLPKLECTDGLIEHLPTLVQFLREGAFEEIAKGPMALPDDVKQFWDEEHALRRMALENSSFPKPPGDDYKPSSDDESEDDDDTEDTDMEDDTDTEDDNDPVCVV